MQTDSSRRSSVVAYLRLAMMIFFLAGLSVYYLLGHASAELSEHSLAIGRGIEAVKREHPGTTRMLVNGQALALNSRSVEESVEHVLDRFGELCLNASGGGLERELAKAKAARPLLASKLDFRRMFVFRSDADSSGEAVSGCIAAEGQRSFGDWIAKLEQVAETGDFGRLGQFRYVFARPSRDGSTHVLTVWSEGELPLDRMFPSEGDVPGEELVPGVRPSASRRVISAHAPLNGFASVVYESSEPPVRALEDYDTRVRAQGYIAVMAPKLDEVPVPVLAYHRNDQEKLVVIAHENGAGTLFSTLRIRGGGHVDIPLVE